MINMLIAVFTTTYETLQKRSDIRWASDRFELFTSGIHMLPLGCFNPLVQIFLFIWTPIALTVAILRRLCGNDKSGPIRFRAEVIRFIRLKIWPRFTLQALEIDQKAAEIEQKISENEYTVYW